mgnify:CR=1 FL=1
MRSVFGVRWVGWGFDLSGVRCSAPFGAFGSSVRGVRSHHRRRHRVDGGAVVGVGLFVKLRKLAQHFRLLVLLERFRLQLRLDVQDGTTRHLHKLLTNILQ